MRIEGLTFVLENRAELNDPVLTDIEWSHYYRSIPESSGWRVAVGFRKQNDSNWYEVETDWAWGYQKTFK